MLENAVLKNSPDEIELFFSKDFWAQEDELVENLNDALSPHSNRYYSEYCPLFSYELESLDKLGLFSNVLLRDGAVPLLDFFLRFPSPLGLKTKVLIHESLLGVVPKAWSNQTYGYFFNSLGSKSSKKAFYLNSVNIYGTEEREKLKSDLHVLKDHGYQTISFCNTIISSMKGHVKAIKLNALSLFVSDSLQICSKLNLNAIFENEPSMNVGEAYKVSDNTKTWFRDSFLEQSCLFKGLVNVDRKTFKSEDYKAYKLSPYHEIQIVSKSPGSSEKFWDSLEGLGVTSNRGLISSKTGMLEDYFSKDLISIAQEYTNENVNNIFSI